MTYEIISTGSQGNAVLIEGRILIDCGVPFKALKPYAKQLRLVLLTHIHSDHFKPRTVAALCNERPALRWGCCEWMVQPLVDAGADRRRIDVLLPGHTYHYEGLGDITPEAVPHNVPNCGYRIQSGGERLFYATDAATLDGICAKDYDLYLIEANHTEAEIQARMEEKLSSGEFAYEFAAAQNHLSREQAEAWLMENAGENSRYQFLHQHKKKAGDDR